MENSDRQPSVQSNRGSKVIHIQTCRECRNHRSNTWHDEAKYEGNYAQVKAAIESANPEVTVERKVDGPLILGGFEIMHGKKVLFSKKTSGLWPNPQAVAQRVQLYFNDLDSGRDVSLYGTQREKAYTPQKKPRLGSAYSTGINELNAFNSKGFSPEKQQNNDLHSSPETGYRETEEKNDEVEQKEEKQEEQEEKAEHVTSTANQHQKDQTEAKHEEEVPSSPVKQEAPHQEHKNEEEHAAADHQEPKSAASNAQKEEQSHPEPENKEESAGLPQNKSEVQEAQHDENKAENHEKPPAQEHKEEVAQENEDQKVKAQKNPTEDEYPEDFGGN